MTPSGYALVRLSDSAVLTSFRDLPGRINITEANIVAFSAELGWESGGYRLVARLLASPPPEAPHTITSSVDTFDGQNVMVTREYALKPVPRPRVRKSTIVTRLETYSGGSKLAAARQALAADLYAQERWYVPDQPSIYADDPTALALLRAIGADKAIILASDDE